MHQNKCSKNDQSIIDIPAIFNEYKWTIDDIHKKLKLENNPDIIEVLTKKILNPDRRLLIEFDKIYLPEQIMIRIHGMESRNLRNYSLKPESLIDNLLGFGFNINCDMEILTKFMISTTNNDIRKTFIIDYDSMVYNLALYLEYITDKQKNDILKGDNKKGILSQKQRTNILNMIGAFLANEISKGSIIIIIIKEFSEFDIRIDKNINAFEKVLNKLLFIITPKLKVNDNIIQAGCCLDDYIFWLITSAAFSYHYYYNNVVKKLISEDTLKNTLKNNFIIVTDNTQKFDVNDNNTLFSRIFPDNIEINNIDVYINHCISQNKYKDYKCENEYINIITDIFLLDKHNCIAKIFKPYDPKDVEHWIEAWTKLTNEDIFNSYAGDFYKKINWLQKILFETHEKSHGFTMTSTVKHALSSKDIYNIIDKK